MLRFVLFSLVLPLTLFAVVQAKEESCPDGKKHYRATLRHIESGGIGYDSGYTTLEVFLASDPSRWAVTPFFDARGHVFDTGKWAANVGVGIRALWGNWACGINTYYDYRNAGRFNSNQLGLGFEVLGELLDFRINGYLPLGAKNSVPYDVEFGTFSGNFLLLSQTIQSAMKGADAEFGFHFGKTENFDFYAATGPYYFKGEVAPATWGGKARVGGTFKEILTVEVSDSYDSTFHNKFQGQVGLTFAIGPKSKVNPKGRPCKTANILNDRMLQPVGRQEIIVVDNVRTNGPAINPATGLPYVFLFVDNTSNSDGTYESPYHSFAQVEATSAPNDIIYVFPGDGTTTGMDSGLTLKASQKLWGSAIGHSLQTTQGMISIPPQSSSTPTLTNIDIDTDGNIVDLATNNEISGLIFSSPFNDALFGDNAQNLTVSYCTFEGVPTFPIETTFTDNASISITNNQFLNNTNGISLILNGPSTVVCSNNTFEGQTSPSEVPLEISATSNSFTTQIENNLFNSNNTGSVRFNVTTISDCGINLINNTITNNMTGSQSTLASSLVIIANGANENCSIVSTGNTFSGNGANSLYLHTSGSFTTLGITASTNLISNNGGSALVVATPITDTLILDATDNTITNLANNGFAIIASGNTAAGTITINNNTITDIGGLSNGISLNQDFSTLTLTIQNNIIDNCEGTGIISYAPDGINSFVLNISNNTISNCQNMSSNAAPGLDIEQYVNLTGSITNNTLSNNTGTAVYIGSSLTPPTPCLTFSGNNSSTDYFLDGNFNLTPCNAVNEGTINTSGTITSVQSCPAATPCPR